MVIEVLYVPGCPNHQTAIDSLKNLLRSAAIDTPIQEIAVTDEATAGRLKFPGSPTIRIDGIDMESRQSRFRWPQTRSARDAFGSHLHNAIKEQKSYGRGHQKRL
jgi:hypothetical protein